MKWEGGEKRERTLRDYLDLDFNLSDEDIAIKEATHKFAKEVMRPVAKELDEMTPEEVIAPGSPFWDFMKKAYKLKYHTILLPDTYGGGSGRGTRR